MTTEFDNAVAGVLGQPADPQPAADPFDAAVAGALRPDSSQAARAGFALAAGTNPDAYAEAQRVARRANLPLQTVLNNTPEAKRQAQIGSIDFETLGKTAPATAALLADVEKAKIAHDNVDNMSGLETVLTSLGKAAKYIVSAPDQKTTLMGDIGAGLYRANRGAAGVFQAGAEIAAPLLDPLAGTILPENPLRRVASGFADLGAQSEASAKELSPPQQGIVGGGVSSGVQSLVQNTMLLPLAFTPAGPFAALMTMAGMTGGQSYQDAREKGLTPGQALPFAASQAAIEYATEKLPVSRLLGDVTAGAPLLKTLARQVTAEIPGEQVATVLQDLNEWAVLNPEKPFSDYLAERPSAAAQTLIATIVGVGGNVTVMRGLDRVLTTDQVRAQRASEAEQQAQMLAQLNGMIAADKVLARDPETFEQFVASAAENGPVQQVFIDANTLMQSGVAEQLAEVSPAVAAQLPEALQTGGQIAIPVEEYAARIAPTEAAAGLLDHIKTDPEGFSRAEAQEYLQSHAEELRAEVERALAEQQEDAAHKESAEAVRAAVNEQLTTAARFTPQVNDAYSTMVGNFYAVQAARLGTTPEALFQQYPLRVVAENIAGGRQFSQDSTPITKLTGAEIAAADTDIKTLRDAAKSWYRENLAPRTVTREDIGAVNFTARGLNKMASSSANPDKLRLVAALPEIVGQGKYLGSVENRDAKTRKNIPRYHWIEGVVDLRGSPVAVRVAVEEHRDGKLYYNHTLPGKEYFQGGNRGGQAGPIASPAESTTTDRAASSNDTVPGFSDQLQDSNVAQDSDTLNMQVLEQGQGAPRGSFNPDTNTIALLKNADLSTFLHESGHFFLEVQFDMAARLGTLLADGQQLSEGETSMLRDTQALLDWFGVRDLQEWYGLDFEQKRSYHEQFARGFEAYLYEGKAPSIDTQGLFQRFRAWLLNVYRDLKALNVELSDEVRSVMDRMLATTEQITLAEQGRSMLPLFESAEQAGMTPAEFAAYQALGVDATNDAIQDLQARGLRDMRWLHNAKGRMVKQLQKDAAAQRAEVRAGVRTEVMSQPIYRAWQFLTAKITADDRIVAPRPAKSDPETVDNTLDSLHTAIAKLGGLQRDELTAQWGLDPQEKSPVPVFGKPTVRKTDGLPLDRMAELLGQYGYLSQDENGRWDLSEFEDRFHEELRGSPQYSFAYDYSGVAEIRPGDQVTNPNALGAARLDLGALTDMALPDAVTRAVKDRRMTATDGLHPDIVADMFGFTSGDELVRKLAEVAPPREEIEALTDVRMLEQFGDLASPEAIERAADKAIHNEARARFVATEANALAQAAGQRKVLASAARSYARALIDRKRVRDLRAGQYANAEARAARNADRAMKSGDLALAAAEKRNQLVQNQAARAAHDAQDEIERGLRYLNKFAGDIKGLDADYAEQIEDLLERFDLRKGQSLKSIDKRTALAEWLRAQREAGFEPDIPPALEDAAFRTSYKNLTVEEFRGLVDSVRQIEHLGRLKNRLLTAADQRAYEAVREEITASIREHAGDRQADTRTPTTNAGRALQGLKRFWSSHIKAATWARVMDGGNDGGPVWEYFIRSSNDRGDMETTMRAEATAKLTEILAPVFKLGRMGGSGQFFPTINRSLNREARLAIALNMGNAGNMQRLLGGEGWTLAQITPVLQSLTAREWQTVQAVWDHFESYRPQIAAKERRIYGKEPEWVDPQPLTVTTADGQALTLRGGYYPIKYDPAASQRAEEHADAEDARRQLQGAYTTATTRRSFTKSRADEVAGRPLLYTLAGMYSGVNDVIHDLAWHEWLIDANRLLRSQSIDKAIRDHYGPEAKQQLKTWVQDVAEGDKAAANAGEMALGRLRQGVSAAGLGFNVMSAAVQFLGLTQSIVRVGTPWVARGVAHYIGSPIAATREANAKSSFMENRARTRFRELNELRNQVQDQGAFNEFVGRYAYFMMMRAQQMVDVPTWWGAYEKAIAGGNDEARAVSLADQAVIDAQGGGQTKDLSAIERGGPALRLFTVFYSFMNTALNLGVAQTMSANTPRKRAKLAVDFLMLYTVPAVLGAFIKDALTPGDAGDDDWEQIARKLIAEQLSYLMGLMFVVREFSEASKIIAGAEGPRDYAGPAGVRGIGDSLRFIKQAQQGEFDDAFRKAAINLLGDFSGLPAAQINRTITGTQALAEGKTVNPASIAFGFQEPR